MVATIPRFPASVNTPSVSRSLASATSGSSVSAQIQHPRAS